MIATAGTGRRAGGLLVAAACCASLCAAVEIQTLDGRTIAPQAPGEEFRRQQEEHLRTARVGLAENPGDPEAWIWVGRRLAYLGRYDEALEAYGEGIARFPSDARFLRHRGHRFVTLRRLDEAVDDLSAAARLVAGQPDRVEPDGLPNARGIPTSTLKTNIWYHLGLALYLQGDFEGAIGAYQRCSALAANPDMLVAADYWLYLALRRAGREAEAADLLAAVQPDLDLIENDGYYELLRTFQAGADGSELLAAAGAETAAVSFPTTAYGIGAWNLLNGRAGEARRIFDSILASPAVAAFGYIAAEAEVARSTD